MSDYTPAHAERIAAKEAELAAARGALDAVYSQPAGTSRMRGKQHGVRVDAQIRRGAALSETVQRLGRELDALRRQGTGPASAPLDLARLPVARYVRTRHGWYEVVKVNRVTVKVQVDPGWDDLIKIGKILEIREG